MALEREHRLDTELNRLLDDLAAMPVPERAKVPGKRTLLEQMSLELTRQEMARAKQPVMVPGRSCSISPGSGRAIHHGCWC